MFAIAYVSTAVRLPSRFDLEYLLIDARAFNAQAHVTGALLLHDVTFFQYFEGERGAVFEVYERIKRSRLHRDLVELFCEVVPVLHFDGWHMGFADAPPGTLLELAHAQWRATAETSRTTTVQTDGLKLLLDFWGRARRDPV